MEPAPLHVPWVLRHKVELPDPIEGYVRRPEVEEKCALSGHRVTVLHAPAGFGKTAVLARRCRVLSERGLAVAWLPVDEEDGPESVARLLVLAFEALAGAPDTDPLLPGMFSFGVCFTYNQMTEFDVAIEWAARARAPLGRASPFLAHVDLQAGSVAPAGGRNREARACYGRALQVARASHLRDAGAVVLGEVLAAELQFERTADSPRLSGPGVSPRLLGECSAWLDIYAAGIGVGAETALLRASPRVRRRPAGGRLRTRAGTDPNAGNGVRDCARAPRRGVRPRGGQPSRLPAVVCRI